MVTAVLVIHVLVIISMICIILVQRSEGGGLGMSIGNGLVSARSASDFLTRTTAILAFIFFLTSITLAFLSQLKSIQENSILDIEKSRLISKEKFEIKSDIILLE